MGYLLEWGWTGNTTSLVLATINIHKKNVFPGFFGQWISFTYNGDQWNKKKQPPWDAFITGQVMHLSVPARPKTPVTPTTMAS